VVASPSLLPALIGAMVTLALFLGGVIFRMGHQSARIEALETWRGSIRQDMHEISSKLESVGVDLRHLTTLIEERTSKHRHEDAPFLNPPSKVRT
jgi:hypothetical protein